MDTIDPVQVIFAFLLVIGLIGLMALGLKRYNVMQKQGKTLFGIREEAGRVKVVEVRYLDAKRRLVLIRRDGVEHLLLLGGSSDLVIESGIAAEPGKTNA
jgi:flagellar protein FliO/FliZ